MLGYQYTTSPTIKKPDNNIISDTTKWTLISGVYNATGTESFLTIIKGELKHGFIHMFR